MTGLQEATYIVALIYMGISLILIFGLLTAVLVIRKKVVSLEQTIKEKIDKFTAIPSAIGDVIETVQQVRNKHK
jgi:hypothetical protein